MPTKEMLRLFIATTIGWAITQVLVIIYHEELFDLVDKLFR